MRDGLEDSGVNLSCPELVMPHHLARHRLPLTIGIQGPDAHERINQLRNALAKLITKYGWTVRYGTVRSLALAHFRL
ncbi:hypothetical protein [Nonomuraea jabiensis]|uniref:hypothetical protein n=1 Tax=Nonomuraea jabiensis TaxID=882448 RepID=UPI00367B64FA